MCNCMQAFTLTSVLFTFVEKLYILYNGSCNYIKVLYEPYFFCSPQGSRKNITVKPRLSYIGKTILGWVYITYSYNYTCTCMCDMYV